MKKSEVPQEKPTAFDLVTPGCYALDEQGAYVLVHTEGWEVTNNAAGTLFRNAQALRDAARREVLAGKASPLRYHMVANAMSVGDVARYTGLWRWQVRRHLRPGAFRDLAPGVLQRYADLFRITVQELLAVPD